MNRTILAGVDTVHAHHAAAIVDLMFLGVDAGSLALFPAKSAVAAFLGVNDRCKQTES